MTPDNSNLPLNRSSFCFPSDHFYIILPSITWTMFWAQKVGKKQSTGVRNIEFWISHVMYDNKFETKENETQTKDKIEP